MDKKYICFRKCGRLGNAIFRYLAAILLIDKYNLEYILEDDLNLESYKNFYSFIEGKDFIGNDISIVNTNINIPTIMKDCFYNKDSDGFNTLGFIKKNINLNNLTSNMYINKKNGHGLYYKNIKIINDSNYIDEYYLNKSNISNHILLDGYFQFGHIYLDSKDKIFNLIDKYKHIHYIQEDTGKRFLFSDLFEDIDINILNKKYDIVINIRLGDFNGRIDYIHWMYYIKLFESIGSNNFKDKKIAIVHEKLNRPDDFDYINICKKWFQDNNLNINIESNDVLIDFNIMKQTDILICSNSTLSWTSAYLSKHIKKCYMPNYNWFYVERPNIYFKKPITNTILFDVESTLKYDFKAIIITIKEFNQLRLNHINKLICFIESIGIEYELFDGINGKNIEIYSTLNQNEKELKYNNKKILYNSLIRLNGKPMKISEFGCALSHLEVYSKLLKDIRYNNYIIFEDDAEIICNQNTFLNLINIVPINFDLCHIALSDWHPFFKLKQVNNYYYNIKKNYFNRTTGYILSKNGASKLLNKYPNHVNVPSDDLLFITHFQSNDFKLYVPEKFVVKEIDNNISTMNFY